MTDELTCLLLILIVVRDFRAPALSCLEPDLFWGDKVWLSDELNVNISISTFLLRFQEHIITPLTAITSQILWGVF